MNLKLLFIIGSGPPFKGHAETRAVAGPSFISQQGKRISSAYTHFRIYSCSPPLYTSIYPFITEHETVDVLKPVEIGNEPVISTATSDPFTPQGNP